MIGVVAAVRGDDVNVALFVHVLGAMLLVGTLLAVGVAIVEGWRRRDAAQEVALTRFGLWTLLLGVLPAYLVMRVGAEWVASKYPESIDETTWIGIGYITADLGALLILVSLVLSGIGLRRLRRDGGVALGRAVGVISVLLLAAYLVAVWAMTTKP